MFRRAFVACGAAALAAALLSTGLAGAQLGDAREDPPTKSPSPEKTETTVPVRQVRAQQPFKLGSLLPFSSPDGVLWADAVVTPDGVIAAGDETGGAVIGLSADGETWDPVLSGSIGAVDLSKTELTILSSSGSFAGGIADGDVGRSQVAFVETSGLGSSQGVVLDVTPAPVAGVAEWTTIIDDIVESPSMQLVMGRTVGMPSKGFDPADPAAVRAVQVGVPFVFTGARPADLVPAEMPGVGWLRAAIATPSGLMAFGAGTDGYPTIWASDATGAWTQMQPSGLDRLDAVLAADSQGTDISLVGVTIEGPMVWRSNDGGATFGTTSLASRPEDIFDVFAEQVVITDNGTLVLATRRAPIVTPAASTEELARAESFIETLVWFVAHDGTITRATGTELFGTDAQVVGASSDGARVIIRVADEPGSERVVFAQF